MLASLLLVAALGIVGWGLATGNGLSGWVVRIVGRTSRRRMLFGWAVGTAVTYGLTTLVALALLGRLGVAIDLPIELIRTAWGLGLPGWIEAADLAWLGGMLGLGAVIGTAILWIRQRLGKPGVGLGYRSPAAMREAGEWPAAAALAVAAGVGEELFFRLLLPLLVAIVTGSGLAGLVVGWAAFVALHRYQGAAGMVAVAAIGVVFAYLYLLTGRLWFVMLLHVAIDLNAFILRPWLTRVRT